MTGSDEHPKGRLWLSALEVIVATLILAALVFAGMIGLLLLIPQLTDRDLVLPLVLALGAVSLVASRFLSRLIVRGGSYTDAQRLADERRHAELFGPAWHYQYLRDMTPDEEAVHLRAGRWMQRLFAVSLLVTVPAGLFLNQPILWVVPVAVLGLGVVLTYWRAQSFARKR